MPSRCGRPTVRYLSFCWGLILLQWFCLTSLWTGGVNGMSRQQMKDLRDEAEAMFYHGYDNYMRHAFPEDELRPLTCTPLTRDGANPSHIELNDALGNYSLTLIDSLSTLAIIASAIPGRWKSNRALAGFQSGIVSLVQQYGDGTNTTSGFGRRAKGFDLDSKVQVFETIIRGVGGLVSAHLFAVGDLPINGYNPKSRKKRTAASSVKIKWPSGFVYNGQLLRLAEDLAHRLLPAFVTPTGMPYPRVNLRHGVPFYANSPLNHNAEIGQCPRIPNPTVEITETCSAGAGSLVLEFTTLSRLSGNPIFEQVAKRAFWAVWDRRSSIGLVGSGIDAESGQWTTPYTGIGAGIDSFYEYAAKASVLLSGHPVQAGVSPTTSLNLNASLLGDTLLVSEYRQTAEAFGHAWRDSHISIKRHLYRGEQFTHPHYIQSDLFTGASRAYWIDSLSAFYPGVLAVAGELDEAVETHLLHTAVWTRYSGIPERWSVSSGGVESGLGWWGGRPEFIESTYYIYQATKDPWYLHVGEMVMRDIKRRCWVKCGWSGIQDVRNGDKSDRMESFFLGETAKYLFLLFDPDHPLNKIDAPYVFSTEGHPLIIPQSSRRSRSRSKLCTPDTPRKVSNSTEGLTCPKPPPMVPFSISPTAARKDVFHAAKLARLHLMPHRENVDSPLVEYASDHPSVTLSDVRSPSNYTYYPWTLPTELVPFNGISSKINVRHTFDITFPSQPNTILGPGTLQRVGNGIFVNSISGLRLGMIQDAPPRVDSGVDIEHYRIQSVNNIMLGRDEKIYLTKDTASSVVSPSDPNFTRVRDLTLLDIVVDLAPPEGEGQVNRSDDAATSESLTTPSPTTPSNIVNPALSDPGEAASSVKQAFSMLLQQVGLLINEHQSSPVSQDPVPPRPRAYLPAILPVGAGAAPLPDVEEASPPDINGKPQGSLIWHSVFVADHACSRLPSSVPKEHQVIVMKRGGCNFFEKLQNIPTFAPTQHSLQLVIVVSYDESTGVGGSDVPFMSRPLLNTAQTTRSGLQRRHPFPMVMVGGGEGTYELMKRSVGVGLKRRYEIRAQGVPISNLIIL